MELDEIKEKIDEVKVDWPEEKVVVEKEVIIREPKRSMSIDFLKSSFNLLLLIAGISAVNFGISICLIFMGNSLVFPLAFFAVGFFVILVFSIVCVKIVYSQNRNTSYTML